MDRYGVIWLHRGQADWRAILVNSNTGIIRKANYLHQDLKAAIP